MSKRKTAVNILKLSIVLVIVYFIVKTVTSEWQGVSSFEWQIQPALLIMSGIAFTAAYALLALIWRNVLALFGHHISYREAWAIYFVGNLGRYIPGKVWTIAGVAYMADRSGIPAVTAGTAAVCAQAYSILSSFVFFVLFFILRNPIVSDFNVLWILPVPVILMLVFLVPRNLERILNSVLSIMGRDAIHLGFGTATAVYITFLYFCSWIVFGGAFWLFVSSIAGAGLFDPLVMTGAYAVAYVTGYLALLVPGGLGVREGILSILLTGTVPVGVASVVAISTRLMVTIIELLCVGAVLTFKGVVYGKEKKEAGN